MALAKGTNSYATVAEADTYFGDRLDVSAWEEADEIKKAQALVTATTILDDQPWIGRVASDVQPLAFPRSGSYFDPRLGTQQEFSSNVPTRVINAVYELAYHMLNNDGLLDDTGNVVDLQVGSVQLTTVRNPNLVPATVRRLIRPMLVNAGSNSWWRAN